MTPITRPVSANPPGTNFVRYLKSLKYGVAFAEGFRDSPTVLHALRTRAAVSGLVSGDAPDLQQLGIADRDLALLLSGVSTFEACRTRMRELPFGVSVPRETTAGSGGGFILEGASMPVVRSWLDTLRFKPARVGSVVVFADEVLRSPLAEGVILNAALAAVGRTESNLFLNPALGPSGDAPGSVTFGAVEITPTASLSADLASMVSAIQTSGKGLCWIVSLPVLASITASLGAAAADVPRTLCGVPIILSPNSPAGLVVLCDLQEVAFASGALDVEVSDQTSLEMESTPTNSISTGSPAAPVETQVISLFQSDSTAFKVSRFLNWSVVRSGAVSYMTLNTGSPA